MLDVARSAKSPHILIVDDDDDDVFLMKSALKRIGWGAGATIDCRCVDNGVDALALLSRKELLAELPSAVILDINMPKLDGISVLRALRYSLSLRDLPIFVLTTTATETIHRTAMDLGATKIFVKPNSMGELTNVVMQMLEIMRAGALADGGATEAPQRLSA